SPSRATECGCCCMDSHGSTRWSPSARNIAGSLAEPLPRRCPRVRRLSSRLVTAPAPSSRGFDPEAEQEVDFARYARLLAARWWLLAAGLVAGAVIGYLVSLGGTQVYSATATLYLGQPYTASGNSPALGIQTNPGAVSQVIHSALVDSIVAQKCK